MRLSVTVLLLSALAGVAHAGDAARGKELYESRFTGCHSIDANRVGPAHSAVSTQDSFNH
jgi:cytochrome c